MKTLPDIGRSEVLVTSWDELSRHKTPGEDLWIMIEGKIYDLSQYEHPGGSTILLKEVGKDAKVAFDDQGHSKAAKKKMDLLYIGQFQPGNSVKQTEVKDEDVAPSLGLRIFLVVIFWAVTTGLYFTIVQMTPLKPENTLN